MRTWVPHRKHRLSCFMSLVITASLIVSASFSAGIESSLTYEGGGNNLRVDTR